jgi:hypothetical protein
MFVKTGGTQTVTPLRFWCSPTTPAQARGGGESPQARNQLNYIYMANATDVKDAKEKVSYACKRVDQQKVKEVIKSGVKYSKGRSTDHQIEALAVGTSLRGVMLGFFLRDNDQKLFIQVQVGKGLNIRCGLPEGFESELIRLSDKADFAGEEFSFTVYGDTIDDKFRKWAIIDLPN